MSTLVHALAERARAAPDALAFACRDDRISFGELFDQARRLGRILAGLGSGYGERCAIVLPSSLHFVRAFYGAQVTGAATVALNPALPPGAIARRLRLVRPRVTIATPGAEAALAAAARAAGVDTTVVSIDSLIAPAPMVSLLPLPEPDPEAPAVLQFTSGTTGDPKAAVLKHRNLTAFFESFRTTFPVGEADVIVYWAPLFHNMGLIRAVCGGPYYGSAAHLIEPGLPRLREWLETLTEARGTLTGSSDFWFRMAAQRVDPAGLDLSPLRIAINGSESVRASTIGLFEQRFGLRSVVRPAYGLSEATLAVAYAIPGEPLRVDSHGIVSVGRPQHGVRVQIVDQDGRQLPPGMPGEIAVAGPTVFAGYFDDNEGTRAVIREGWLHTGDVGALDADGYLYVHGRLRALIKRAGATIIPREAEDAALSVAGVVSAAAVGLPDETGSTEQLVVVVEIDPAVDRSSVERPTLSQRVGRAVTAAIGLAPSRVLAVEAGAIPRTENGKVRYHDLRRLVAEGLRDGW